MSWSLGGWRALVAAAVLVACAAAGWFYWQGRGPDSQGLAQRAEQRLDQGQPMGAVIDIKNALANDADSAYLRLLLARALLAVGDANGAAEEADRAARLGAEEARVLPLKARIALARQRPAEAVTLLDSHRFNDPEDQAAARTLLAQARFEMGDVAAANAALAEALALRPEHVPGLRLRARLLAAAGDQAGALAVQSALQAKWPANAAVRSLRGELMAGRDDAQAVLSFGQALERDPRLDTAHLGLVMAHLRLRAYDAAAAQVAAMRKVLPNLPVIDYVDALTSYLRGDHREAAERIEQVLKRGAPNAAALQLAGMAQARLGNRGRAESLLSGALALAPGLADARQELALLQLKAGRPDRAVQLLEPVLRPDLQDAQVWSTAGQAYAQLGRFAEADAAFARATRIAPDNPAVRREVARSQIARGQLELGVRALESAAAADAQGIVADLALVSAQMQRGDLVAATRALDAATRKQPQSAMPWLLRGVIAERQNDRGGARTAYESALQREPRMLRPVYALAGLDIAERRFDAARARFDAAIKLEPKSAPLRLALADLALRRGAAPAEVAAAIDASVQSDPLDAANWVQAIDLQRRLGDPAALLSRSQAANAAVADDSTLLLELAGAQVAVGDRQQALVSLRRLVQLRPAMPEAQLRLATVLGLDGQLAQARAPLAKALELAPDSPAVLRGAIAMALADREQARALQLARSLQQRTPLLPGGWQLEAEVHESLKDVPAAIAAWRTALEKGAGAEAAVSLHRLLLDSDAAAAEVLVRRWRETQPRDAFFLTHLAETAARAGRRAEAVAHYRQALTLAPDHVGVLNNLAELLLTERPAEALPLAERASQLAPAEPAILDTLAAARAAQGQLDAALQAQERAVAFAPAEERLRLNLGRLWLKKGDKEKAREQLRRAERAANPSVRDEAVRLLAASA